MSTRLGLTSLDRRVKWLLDVKWGNDSIRQVREPQNFGASQRLDIQPPPPFCALAIARLEGVDLNFRLSQTHPESIETITSGIHNGFSNGNRTPACDRLRRERRRRARGCRAHQAAQRQHGFASVIRLADCSRLHSRSNATGG